MLTIWCVASQAYDFYHLNSSLVDLDAASSGSVSGAGAGGTASSGSGKAVEIGVEAPRMSSSNMSSSSRQGAGKNERQTMTLFDLLKTCLWDSSDEMEKLHTEVLGMQPGDGKRQCELRKKVVGEDGLQSWHRITFIPCYDPVTGR